MVHQHEPQKVLTDCLLTRNRASVTSKTSLPQNFTAVLVNTLWRSVGAELRENPKNPTRAFQFPERRPHHSWKLLRTSHRQTHILWQHHMARKLLKDFTPLLLHLSLSMRRELMLRLLRKTSDPGHFVTTLPITKANKRNCIRLESHPWGCTHKSTAEMATGRWRGKMALPWKYSHDGLSTERNRQPTKKLRYLLLQSFLPGVLANPWFLAPDLRNHCRLGTLNKGTGKDIGRERRKDTTTHK